MVERQCHQKQNFQSLLSRNDFYGDRTFYHITAVYTVCPFLTAHVQRLIAQKVFTENF